MTDDEREVFDLIADELGDIEVPDPDSKEGQDAVVGWRVPQEVYGHVNGSKLNLAAQFLVMSLGLNIAEMAGLACAIIYGLNRTQQEETAQVVEEFGCDRVIERVGW